MTTNPIKVTADDYALGVLRRHRDSMTRPDFQQIADDSGLYAHEVQALWEKLLAGRDPKPSTGGPVTKAAPPVLARVQGPPVETPPTWQAAKDHPSARIRRKYNQAVTAIAALEEALTKDTEQAKLRAKEARLKAELEKVRRELAGDQVKRPCPDCGQHIGTTAQALAVHRSRSRKHKGGAMQQSE
jgi:hypothetical protein